MVEEYSLRICSFPSAFVIARPILALFVGSFTHPSTANEYTSEVDMRLRRASVKARFRRVVRRLPAQKYGRLLLQSG